MSNKIVDITYPSEILNKDKLKFMKLGHGQVRYAGRNSMCVYKTVIYDDCEAAYMHVHR